MEKYKNMCLVKYSTIEESIKAVVHMHQQEVYGRLFIDFYNLYIVFNFLAFFFF